MKDFEAMKPREVEAYLRQVILDTFGDNVENVSSVFSGHGYYTVWIDLTKRGGHGKDQSYGFENFRKTEAPKIAKAIRALGSRSK